MPFHSDEQRIANAAPHLHSAHTQLRKLLASRIHEQDGFLEGLSLKIEAAEELTKVPRLSAESSIISLSKQRTIYSARQVAVQSRKAKAKRAN